MFRSARAAGSGRTTKGHKFAPRAPATHGAAQSLVPGLRAVQDLSLERALGRRASLEGPVHGAVWGLGAWKGAQDGISASRPVSGSLGGPDMQSGAAVPGLSPVSFSVSRARRPAGPDACAGASGSEALQPRACSSRAVRGCRVLPKRPFPR